MTDFIKNFRAIHHFISGIFSNSRGEYTLTFDTVSKSVDTVSKSVSE